MIDVKPVVKGPVDGNIFGIMGSAQNAMKRAGVERSVCSEMLERAMQAEDYHAALGVIMEYVDFDL